MIAQTSISAPENQPPPQHVVGLVPGPGSPRILVSPLLAELGVRHGFTTRLGGVSTGRYESLNLGEKWGDEPARVRENLRRVASDGHFAAEELCQVVQVHGTEVALVDADTVERRGRQADGMATRASRVLGSYSADCVCILIADGQGRAAAVHAGWRGTVAGIAAQAVDALVSLGARPGSLRAALGPSIGPCCFQVKEDVAGRFRSLLPAAVLTRPDAQGQAQLYVDLRRTNRHFLESAGVPADCIADTPPCTCCDPQRFFSFRRDGAGIGQHLAFIVGGCS